MMIIVKILLFIAIYLAIGFILVSRFHVGSEYAEDMEDFIRKTIKKDSEKFEDAYYATLMIGWIFYLPVFLIMISPLIAPEKINGFCRRSIFKGMKYTLLLYKGVLRVQHLMLLIAILGCHIEIKFNEIRIAMAIRRASKQQKE